MGSYLCVMSKMRPEETGLVKVTPILGGEASLCPPTDAQIQRAPAFPVYEPKSVGATKEEGRKKADSSGKLFS